MIAPLRMKFSIDESAKEIADFKGQDLISETDSTTHASSDVCSHIAADDHHLDLSFVHDIGDMSDNELNENIQALKKDSKLNVQMPDVPKQFLNSSNKW